MMSADVYIKWYVDVYAVFGRELGGWATRTGLVENNQRRRSLGESKC